MLKPSQLQKPEMEAVGARILRSGTRVRLAASSGVLSVVLASYLLCSIFPVLHAPAKIGILSSLLAVSLAWLVGALGTWAMLSRSAQVSLAMLSSFGAYGWIFVPAAFLLLKQRSPWALVPAAVAAALVAVQLGGLLRLARLAKEKRVIGETPRDNRHLLFSTTTPLRFTAWPAVIVSVCLAVIPLCVFMKEIALAAGFFAVATFVFAMQMAIARSMESGAFPERKAEAAAFPVFIAALLVTFFALSPSWRTLGFASKMRAVEGLASLLEKRLVAKKVPSASLAGAGYHGIILWPLPDRSKVLPPVPHPHAGLFQTPVRLMIIPFRGPYLYFKPGADATGPRAHVAQGSPLRVAIHSSSSDWLMMEARQDLAAPVLLSCCEAIEVFLQDGDDTPAGVDVGLLLTDTSSVESATQYLGIERTASGVVQGSRQMPSEEVLRFAIPRQSKIEKFTRITVILFPGAHREEEGRRIAVRQFVLMPR